MKQIILPSTVLEFTWLVIDGFMKKMAWPPSPKKEIKSPQQRRSPRNFKSSQLLATRHGKKYAYARTYLLQKLVIVEVEYQFSSRLTTCSFIKKTDSSSGTFQGFANFRKKHFERTPLSGPLSVLQTELTVKKMLKCFIGINFFTYPYSSFLTKHNKDRELFEHFE